MGKNYYLYAAISGGLCNEQTYRPGFVYLYGNKSNNILHLLQCDVFFILHHKRN